MEITKVIKETNIIIPYVAELMYKGQYNAYLLPEIYEIVNKFMLEQFEEKISASIKGTNTYTSIKNNIENFVAGKNFQQYNKMLSILDVDEIDDYIKKSSTINSIYNDTYLQVEKDFLTNKVNQLNKWQNYNELKGDYLIEYVATNDELTRDEHRALNGIKLPASHSFWNEHTPPWDWNCRCSTKAVRFDKDNNSQVNDYSKSEEMASRINNDPKYNRTKGLADNPYTSGKIWADDHSYFNEKNIEVIKNKLKGQI